MSHMHVNQVLGSSQCQPDFEKIVQRAHLKAVSIALTNPVSIRHGSGHYDTLARPANATGAPVCAFEAAGMLRQGAAYCQSI